MRCFGHTNLTLNPQHTCGRVAAPLPGVLSGHTAAAAAATAAGACAARPCVAYAVRQDSPTDSDEEQKRPEVRRVKRLFRGGGTSSSGEDKAAPAPSTRPQGPGKSDDVLEGFASMFESLAVTPKTRRPPPRRDSYDADEDDLSYLSSDRGSSSRGFGGSSEGRTYGRSSGSGTYGSLTRAGESGWTGRGKVSKGGKKGKKRELTLEDFEGVDPSRLSPQKQQLLAQLQEEADRRERRRLAAKARSEAIPTAPRGSQDPIIFQALTREWDELTSLEEKRGARASARKVARVGLYDRNRALKAVRRKAVQALKRKPEEELTEEERIMAARAKEIRDAAAAKSIQPTKESLAEEARGVPRDMSRRNALPAELVERLITENKAIDHLIKIGRKGAAPGIIFGLQNAWRTKEVVKLRIHDDKSSRKMNLPRINLLLRELEERSGGVVLEANGKSIWMYRGQDWTPPPPPPSYKPPPAEEMLQKQYKPKGRWMDIGGVACYVASSSDSSGSDGSSSSSSEAAAGSSSSGSSGIVPGPNDAMTLVMLPDHFSLAESKPLRQLADKIASKGALVVLVDLLGPPARFRNSNVALQGQVDGKANGVNYWLINRWPLVKKRKLEYMAWYQTGPGSWQQLRPKLLAVLEALQQQGLAGPPPAADSAADSAADAAADTAADAAADAAADTAAASNSSSSSSSGRPLGLMGMGWGTFIGLQAAGDEAVVAAGVQVMAALSPALYNKDFDITKQLKIPVALLPAKYDSMEQMMMFINLMAKPWEQRCIFKRYGKLKPGWSSWLPQWTDERAMRQVAEMMLTAVSWLKRELLGELDGYELPEPQLPAKATAETLQQSLDAAAAKAQKDAAAEQAQAEEDAAGEQAQAVKGAAVEQAQAEEDAAEQAQAVKGAAAEQAQAENGAAAEQAQAENGAAAEQAQAEEAAAEQVQAEEDAAERAQAEGGAAAERAQAEEQNRRRRRRTQQLGR